MQIVKKHAAKYNIYKQLKVFYSIVLIHHILEIQICIEFFQ